MSSQVAFPKGKNLNTSKIVLLDVVPEHNALQVEMFLNLLPGLSSPGRAGRILSFCAAGFGCPLPSLHQGVDPTHSPRYRSSELKT